MQKYVNLVDLVKSFPTSIYLQKSASIQPRSLAPQSLGENSIPYAFASLVVDLQVRGGRADDARLLGKLLEEHRGHAHQEARPGLSMRNPVRVKDKR